MKPRRISSSTEFDDPRYWRFVRDSKLPYGTFGRSNWLVRNGTLRDGAVVVIVVALFAIALFIA